MTRPTLPVASVILALALLIVAGIATATPPLPQQRATLPPTWTPTFTPTITQRPSATPTPTVTPTIPAEIFCADNFVADPGDDGRSYRYTADILLIAGSGLRDTLLLVQFTHRLSGEMWTAEFAQPGYIAYVLPVQRLPRAGLYDWDIVLVDVTGRVICRDAGYFFVGRQEWLEPTETPEGEEQNVIIVTATPAQPTQTPFVIVVTATPEGNATAPSIREQDAATSTPEAVPPTAITPDS
ncbi:MAG: hypothetical protein AAF653_07065 [Chloroflexota bacterium]